MAACDGFSISSTVPRPTVVRVGVHGGGKASSARSDTLLTDEPAASSGVAGYRAVFALPGTAVFLGVGFLARIPSTATAVTLSLHVVLTLQLGYFEAGVVSAVYTVGRVIGSPMLGLLLDWRGLRPMLIVATSAEALFWSAATWLPYPGLIGGALVSGLFGLPISALIRQTLAATVPPRHRRPAYAIDSMSIDLSYIAGPSLGALLVLHGSSALALHVLGIGWAAAGISLWIMNRPTNAVDAAAVTGRRRLHACDWFTPRLGAVFLAAAIVAVLVYSTELTIIAGLHSSGQAEYLAVAYTAWCVASVTGGFCYGAVPRHPGLFVLVSYLALATLPLGFAAPWWSYVLLLIPAGLMCAPPVAAGSEMLVMLSPDRSRGVINGIYDSAMAVGAGVAAPITGLLIDRTSAPVAISVISTSCLVLAGIAGLLAREGR